jgi:Caspase domain
MVRVVVIVLIVLIVWSPVAHAEKRVALVIGNGTYQKVSKLPNPVNDAKAIAGMLRAAGFDEVTLHENLGIRELRQAIKDFSSLARDADTAVVYYSGHGVEANGINYLIPIDAVLDSDIDVPYEAYSLDNLVQVLEPARRLRLVMLDACRDNPFARSMKRTIASRAVGGGLASVEPTSANTLIAFAAKAGSIALDGEGANSPYATAILNNLTTPGLDLRIAFGQVRDEVLKVTRNKQEPFVYGSLGGGEIALLPAKASPQIGPSMPSKPTIDYDKEMEITFWNAVKDGKSKELLQTYLDRFPIGTFAGLARVLVDQLIKEEAARASFARQEEEAKHAQDAKDAVDRARVEELAAARDELRKAQAALKAAVVERETARTMAEEARKVAEAEKASMAKATAEAPKVASSGETRLSQDPVIDHAMLARSIQMELKRVGCEPGVIDGKWGTDARDALRRFIRFAKIDLQSEEPSEAVLIAVTRQMQRVCPAASDSRSPQPHRRDATKRRVAREPSKQPAETEKRGSKGLCWSNVGGRQLAVQPCK